jgi:hypothetical protein
VTRIFSRDRRFADSPLEGAVYCELVSERVLGKLGSDFR